MPVERYILHVGDALAVLKTLPSESVHVAITSPPYFALRNYAKCDCDEERIPKTPDPDCLRCGGTGKLPHYDQQLGLENTPEEWIAKLVEVFEEVRRVLRRDGVCWVNVGSSYFSGSSVSRAHPQNGDQSVSPSLAECEHVPPYGNGDTALEDYPAIDYACSRLCDGCLDDFRNHHARIAGILQPQKQSKRRGVKTDRGIEHLDSIQLQPADVSVHLSTTLESWLRLRGECLRCANRASCLPVPRSSSHDVRLFGDTMAYPSGLHSVSPSTHQTESDMVGRISIADASGSRISGMASDSSSYPNYTITHHPYKPKDDMLLPFRLGLALQRAGWWVRSCSPYVKRSAMPESTQDRPSTALEYVFMLTRSPKYYFDMEAVRRDHQPYTYTGKSGVNNGSWEPEDKDGLARPCFTMKNREYNPSGRAWRNSDFWFDTVGMLIRDETILGFDVNPAGFSEWGDSPHFERVSDERATRGDASDGMIRITTPGCRAHEGQPDSVPTELCGGRISGSLVARSLGIDIDLARLLLSGHAPTALRRELETEAESLGLIPPLCSRLATPNSTQIHRTDPVPGTSPACTVSAQMTADTDGTQESPALSDSVERMNESSIEADSALGALGLSERIESRNEGNCRCAWFYYYTRRTSHFATFPPDLIRPMVLAGTSERGVCPECAAPWVRVVERANVGDWNPRDRSELIQAQSASGPKVVRINGSPYREGYKPPETTGWRAGCSCGHEETVPAVVLDPFAGSGTTLLVAMEYGRRAIGIELSPEYAEMARKRLEPVAAQEGLGI